MSGAVLIPMCLSLSAQTNPVVNRIGSSNNYQQEFISKFSA